MESFAGPIRTANDARKWRKRALALDSERFDDAAAMLDAHRWHAVAARPSVARDLVSAILAAEDRERRKEQEIEDQIIHAETRAEHPFDR